MRVSDLVSVLREAPAWLSDRAFDVQSALAQVAPVAPGGGGGAPAPAAPTGGGGGGQPAGGGSGALQLLFPLLIFAAFYFFLIRPQQKKQKELENKLKKGDRVFTSSGIVGRIIELNDKRATLEVAKGVNMVFLRSAISGLDEADPAKADADKSEAKSEKDAKDTKTEKRA
ncbi:MAG: preprotein translocase subunit YajC [Deltaproteobacteria bacterium]|nr:preprotein translocase subunit YajC [Deltaproteobacteria bacterium]